MAKKAKKKRAPRLREGMNFVDSSVKIPKYLKQVLGVYLGRGRILVDVKGVPVDPGKVGKLIHEVINAYGSYYESLLGVNRATAIGMILSEFGTFLEQQFPTEARVADARRRQEMIREREPAVAAPDLGGRTRKVH